MSKSHRSLGFSCLISCVLLGPAVGKLPAEESPVAAESAQPARGPSATSEVADRLASAILLISQRHLTQPSPEKLLNTSIAAAVKKKLNIDLESFPARSRKEILHEDLSRTLIKTFDVIPGCAQFVTAELEETMLRAMIDSLEYDNRLERAADHTVNAQIESNVYVGIGIAVSGNEQGHLIDHVVAGGTGERAGLLARDYIEEVDGIPMKDKSLNDLIRYLRGPRYSTVKLQVRQPSAGESRVLTITRDLVEFRSLEIELLPEVGRNVVHVKVTRLSGSTAHELREVHEMVQAGKAEAVVLDLRGADAFNLHHATLFLDALLDDAVLGATVSSQGERWIASSPDCLLRDVPMVVLISSSTSGVMEWIAAALQDHGRAKLIGSPTQGFPLAMEDVPVPGTDYVLRLTTMRLKRVRPRISAAGNYEMISFESPIRFMSKGAVANSRLAPMMPFDKVRPDSRPQSRGWSSVLEHLNRGDAADH